MFRFNIIYNDRLRDLMNDIVSTPAARLQQPIRKGIKSYFIHLKQ